MPAYASLSSVMPVASMVTGAAVTAALGDQMRDNLVALWEGWWFRATRSTTQVIGSGATTLVGLDTISQSATSLAEGSISLSAGAVVTGKPGLWMLGGHFTLTGGVGGSLVAIIESTNSPGPVAAAENVNDTTSNKDSTAASITTQVTSTPNTFGLYAFSSSTITVQSGVATALWGVWVGDAP
jgi:hypothetical protein